jgi:hypothetical protein
MPSNMAFHDLTPDKCAPRAAKSLLGLGSKFIPTPKFTCGEKNLAPSLARFERDFYIKVMYAVEAPVEEFSSDPDKQRSKLYVKSKWNPTECDVPNWAVLRLSRFFNRVKRLFKRRRATSNLLPYQERLMELLLNDPDLLFPSADKGLGPCAVKRDQYIEDCLVHLQNESCYRIISDTDAALASDLLEDEIEAWLKKYKNNVEPMHRRYIKQHMDSVRKSPFGQFYILYKIHKGLDKNGRWSTRPVCSDVTSLTHGLGKWVNEMLTPVQKAQPSYFQDSFELKKILEEIELPPNALLFTADATAMYTNIKTDPAIEELSSYLHENKHRKEFNYPCEALIEAINIVFRNNFFKFGDITCQQISGTAMGTPPAPPYATITFGQHENKLIPQWTHAVGFYKRFIDDVFGIWYVNPDLDLNTKLWNDFVTEMNGWHGMEWIFKGPCSSVNFMDLTITCEGNRLKTTVFEKKQNLYLYIPPHSSHPKGVLTGLVFGQVLRLRRLCSNASDADEKVKQFFERLRHRGHSEESLKPIFARAEANASKYINNTAEERVRQTQQKGIDSQKQIYFHLQFHPENPPTRDIQALWTDYMARPPDGVPLIYKKNLNDQRVGFDKLVIANSRPLNLQNRFTVRDIHGRGKPVSEYLA